MRKKAYSLVTTLEAQDMSEDNKHLLKKWMLDPLTFPHPVQLHLKYGIQPFLSYLFNNYLYFDSEN